MVDSEDRIARIQIGVNLERTGLSHSRDTAHEYPSDGEVLVRYGLKIMNEIVLAL
jgi:hypothetical protein